MLFVECFKNCNFISSCVDLTFLFFSVSDYIAASTGFLISPWFETKFHFWHVSFQVSYRHLLRWHPIDACQNHWGGVRKSPPHWFYAVSMQFRNCWVELEFNVTTILYKIFGKNLQNLVKYNLLWKDFLTEE